MLLPREELPVPVAELRFDLQLDVYPDAYLLTGHVGSGDTSKHARVRVASAQPQRIMEALAEVIALLAEPISGL